MKCSARALALLVLFASATTSQGGTLEEKNVRGWIVGAYSDNRTGQFTHCATSVPYRSGITLFFHLGRNFTWSMALYNPQWRATPGRTLNLVYFIDRGPQIPVRARVNRLGLVIMPLADNRALFEAFQRGHRLSVRHSRETFTFLLTNSSKALAATFECVQRYAYSATARNPFLRPPTAPYRAAPQPRHANRGEFRAEAAILAANVLSGSGIAGFRILPREEIVPEAQRFDAVWMADGGLLGTVEIITPANASNVEQIAALLMALDSQACKGAFSSGRYPTQDVSGISRLMTVCTGSKLPEIQYTVARRPAGGFYVLGVAGTGGGVLEAGAKLYDVALRTLGGR